MKLEGFSFTLTKAYVFHDSMIPENSNFNSYIYIIIPISAITLHSNSLVFVIFGIQYHLTEILEQPGGLTSWIYVTDVMQTYVNKEHYRRCSALMCGLNHVIA